MAEETMSEKSARELCQEADLGDEAQAHLHDHPELPVFLDRLAGAGRYTDAVQIWARRLALPQALWWSCLCVWHRVRPQPHEVEDRALRTVLQWLNQPSEANRRACGAAAEKCKPASTPGNIARAAFWSSGSVLPPELPVVTAPPGLPAQCLAAAVITVAEGEGPRVRDAYRLFLGLAQDVLTGTNRWQ
jgi:hypothetical protein